MRSLFKQLGLLFTLTLPMALTAFPATAVSLEDALRAALANSPSLQASRKSWLSSREDIGTSVATSEWRATGTVTGNQYKTEAASANKSGFLDSQSLNATVSLSRNLYDGGQTEENIKLRTIQLDIAEARYRAAEQRLILDTIDVYLTVVKAGREVELNRANVSRLEEHVAAARVRLDAGAATQTQVAQAEARLSRARTTLIAALTSLRNAEDSFTTETGLNPSDLDAEIDAGALPSTLIEADDLARQYDPNVAIARLSVDAAMQQFNSLMASVKPTVAFSLNATEAMAEGTRLDKTEFSAQVKLSTPLMPTASIRAKSRGLSASLESARFDRDSTLRSASLAVRNAFRNLETARSQRIAVDAELAASRLVATGVSNEFQYGQKTTLDVLDAEQDVNDAELRGVSADHAILMAAFRLRAASGLLSAASFRLDDVLGPLEAMEPAEPRFTSWVPLAVEWPEMEGAAGNEAPIEELPAAATAPVPEAEETSLLVLEPASEPAEEIALTEAIAPVVSVVEEEGGIVWNIQTNRP